MAENGLTPEVVRGLAAPFEDDEVEWKPQAYNSDRTRALVVPYVDARVVVRRLDAVAPGKWEFCWEAMDPAAKIVKGTLSIYGVTRQDAGEPGEGKHGDTWKAAVSDALKRCAVLFGVASYLYGVDDIWVDYDDKKRKCRETPRLPASALRKTEPQESDDGNGQEPREEPESSPTEPLKPSRYNTFLKELCNDFGVTTGEVVRLLGKGLPMLAEAGRSEADIKAMLSRAIDEEAK